LPSNHGSGQRLHSPALIADGDHARADAYVSLAVIASAAVVAIGLPIADPIIGVAITLVILRRRGSRDQTAARRRGPGDPPRADAGYVQPRLA
jgi:Co/Zn/Cd efflux system component